jgi:hypothetical protein
MILFLLVGYIAVSVALGIGFYIGFQSSWFKLPLSLCLLRGLLWPVWFINFLIYYVKEAVRR